LLAASAGPVGRIHVEFTGGSITKVVVDVSGAPYIDAETQLAVAFAKD